MRHTRPQMHTARLLALALAFAGTSSAQEGGQAKPVEPKLDLLAPTGQEADQAEMIRLFHEVERALGAIDLELADAGAGEIPLPEGKDSGIERLLRSASTKSDQAILGIDQILELAAKMDSKSGGGT